MPFTNMYSAVMCACLATVLSACGDDDASPSDAGGQMPFDAAMPDSGRDDGGDPATDAGRDAAVDSGGDASDAQCEAADLTDWGALDAFGATRIPLSDFCEDGCTTLGTWSADFDCYDVSDGGEPIGFGDGDADLDSGLFRWWTRTEGCDSVVFETIAPSWPRYYHFATDSGALLGHARVDDIVQPIPHSDCVDAAFVTGEPMAACQDETAMLCERR